MQHLSAGHIFIVLTRVFARFQQSCTLEASLQIFWNGICSLSKTLYWAQLTEDILTKYKHPPSFLLKLFKKNHIIHEICLVLRLISFFKRYFLFVMWYSFVKQLLLYIFVFWQEQNLGPRFGASKMLKPLAASAAVGSKAVALLLLMHCLLFSHCMWVFMFGPCFVVRYFVTFLVLQSSWRGKGSWMLYIKCLPLVSCHC